MQEVGKAGEHLVCADLFLSGHPASIAAEGLPYDIMADIGGSIKKIQVKSTQQPLKIQRGKAETIQVYRFSCCRRRPNSSKFVYTNEIDLIAFVALDTRIVAYCLPNQLTSVAMDFRLKDWPVSSKYAEANRKRDEIAALRAKGLIYKEIAPLVGMKSAANVFDYCKGKKIVKQGFGRLMEDFPLAKLVKALEVIKKT